ncbi:cell wall-binding repeat-containing protein [Haloimpatiens sp. FM7315]|uniref:cell wall-binding repeat-containing protein n=1 Tax=Haloimpatiens sp. FM7315 TaxID=3298609 RepID=UPI00370C5F0E
MFKKFRSKIIVLLSFICIFIFATSFNVYAKNNKYRIYGQDRIKTSVEISKIGWDKGSDYIIIAGGYDYADALSGAPLAKKYNAPILLTSKSQLSCDTLAEIKRLNPKNAIILGGESVISKKAESQLKDTNIKSVERIYGSNRYETALKVAKKIGKCNSVFLTSGKDYADSLSVASISSYKGSPILFTNGVSLEDEVKKYVKDNNISKVYVIGGKSVISDKVLKEFNNAERLFGQNRFETNKAVMEKFIEDIDFEKMYLVKAAGPMGNEFADALSVAPLAAKNNSPLVLTYKKIDNNLKKFLDENIISKTQIVAIGGEKVLPTSILDGFNLDFKAINIEKDNEVFGDEKEVKNIKEDVVVSGNNVTLRNINIKGILTLDPGKKGSVNLYNVNCKYIDIKSGDKNSIHFSKVYSKKVEIASEDDVRLELKDNCKIENIYLKSSVTLENLSGSVDKVEISSVKNVTLDGKFSFVNITADAKVKVTNKSVIDKINAFGKSEIEVEKGAEVKKIEKTKEVKIIGEVKEIVENKNNEEKKDQGSSSVVVEDCFKIIITSDETSEINKDIKLDDKKEKNALEYLKGVASIEEKNGFINGINSLRSKPLKALTIDERKRGILGCDWFIYVNGEKSPTGVKLIYPKKGDVIKFIYRSWDWKDLMDPSYHGNIPIKIIDIPESVKAGENFRIKVECTYYPVYDVEVKVDGTLVTRTDIDGWATLSINTAGKHKVTIEKDGGSYSEYINVEGNSGSGDIDTPKVVFENKEGKYSISILKSNLNKIEVNISSEDVKSKEVIAITLFNENDELSYIGQATLNDGKCKFNTLLDKGVYKGYYKASSGKKINIEFKID